LSRLIFSDEICEPVNGEMDDEVCGVVLLLLLLLLGPVEGVSGGASNVGYPGTLTSLRDCRGFGIASPFNSLPGGG
jgi:hypothetical protein